MYNKLKYKVKHIYIERISGKGKIETYLTNYILTPKYSMFGVEKAIKNTTVSLTSVVDLIVYAQPEAISVFPVDFKEDLEKRLINYRGNILGR